MTGTLRLEVRPLDRLLGDAPLLGRWRRLAAEIVGASYFQTPDWVASWWATVGGSPPGEAGLVWREEDLVGVYPLADTRVRLSGRLPWTVPITTNAGSGIGTDHAGWLATPGADTVLAGWLASKGPLLLKGIPIPMGDALGGRLIEVERCPRLAITELADVMSGKLAKNLRNARRRLTREGVAFAWRGPGEVTTGDLAWLYRLSNLRRAESGDAPIFDDEGRRAFHERMLEWADHEGGNAIVEARAGDRVVGSLYGFMWGDSFAYYQIGWDPAFRHLSLGSVLVLEAIEECARRGLTIFDFLRGAEEYKYRFGAVDVVEGTFAIGRSPALGMLTATGRLRARLRAGADR